MDSSLVRVSKFLSLVLRHKPETIGLTLNEAGWVAISDLIKAANASGRELDHDLLLRVVHENDKRRFAINADGTAIRANQGHSVEIDLGLKPITPPAILYHGTVARFLNGIKEKGLIPGSRQLVHLSSDHRTAEIVGKRRGTPLVLIVDAIGMVDNSRHFYRSENGVWLTAQVPVEFIQFP